MEVRCYDLYGNTVNHLTQWDINQYIGIDWKSNSVPSFHFCNINSDYAIVVEGEIKNGKAVSKIPNILLQSPNTIAVFVYLEDGNVAKGNDAGISVSNISGKTVCTFQIPVRKKPQPQDYEFVENIEYASWVKLEQDLKEYVDSQLVSYNTKLNELAAWTFSSTGMIKKNLLENTMNSETFDGITATVNEDKSIDVSFEGTDITGEDTVLRAFVINTLSLKSGDYILSGCPSGGGKDTYNLRVMDTESNNIIATDTGEGVVFSAEDGKEYGIWLCVSLKDTSKNLTFYPMVRCAVITDKTYERYTPSLQQQIKNISYESDNQEVVNARKGTLVANTFASLSARLSADFNACITQGELEKAIGNAVIQANDTGVGRFWRDETGSICGEIFGNYQSNEASGNYSTARGNGTTASGARSTAEGNETTASGMDSHSEGSGTTASAPMAHSEGGNTEATGVAAHAEGGVTVASGQYAHSEGAGTVASGKASHSEGNGTEARGLYSHAEGDNTIAASARQHVSGKYNVIDELGAYVVIVGNGNSDLSRSNALTLDWLGNLQIAGDVTAINANGDTVGLVETATAVATVDKDAKNNNALYQSTLGAVKKNLLKNTAGTTTQNGITFTHNEDGSVTCSGTATADTNYRYILSDLLPDTNYILSGCPSGGSTTTYNLLIMDSASWSKIYRDTGSSVTFNTGDNNGWHAIIRIAAGQTVDGLTFSPMLRYADVTDGTYEAYTPSLQEQIDELKAQIAAMTVITTDEI